MILNLLVARFFKRDLAAANSHNDPLDKDIQHEEPQQKSKVLAFLANNLHFTTMLPMLLITVLQDINMGLAAGVCVAEVVLVLIIGYFLYKKRYIKIYPKKYDIFNLQLYITITILAFAAPRWLHNWLSMYVNLSNAVFMWLTILLPCYDPFCMDNIRDRIPDSVARHPYAQAMALWMSVTWATALAIMGAAAIVPAAANIPPASMPLTIIICSYVLGIGPLLVAMVVQHIISHVYKKKLLGLKEQAVVQQQQQEHQQQGPQEHAAADKNGADLTPADAARGPDAV